MSLSTPVLYHGDNLLLSDVKKLAANNVAIIYQPESGKIYFAEMEEVNESTQSAKAG